MSAVLGVNFGTHDAAATLVVDGEIVAAIEEERLTRVKHTKAFPSHAIRACLQSWSVDPGELAHVALYVDPRLQLLLAPVNLWHGFPTSIGSLASDLDKYRKRRRLPAQIRDGDLLPDVRVVPVAHHRAHAASAYLTSPFEDALVVTLDGRGEYETACVFDGRAGRLRRLHNIVYPHSFGYLYSALTRYLGFRPQHDEYKVMGLAASGSDRLVTDVAQLARFDDRAGRLRLDLRYFDHHRRPSAARGLFSPALVDLLGPARRPGDDLTDRHRDIAYAAQHMLNHLVVSYLAFAQSLVPRRELCLAGGVALNCVANAAILASGLFDDVYIQPAAGDAGTSLGAALLTASNHDRIPPRVCMDHALLGPAYTEDDIERALTDLSRDRYRVRRTSHPHREAARLLGQEKVIGWFCDRMEFGPRALGARSILASPRDAGTVDRINALIKRREPFRPLAPAVKVEAAADYFDTTEPGRHIYPFMLATAPVRQTRRHLIPAVIHADGTAGLQTVDRRVHPMFWQLLDAYEDVTGLPVILNTSFNDADEPIVCSPADAISTFTRCGLDALVIGSFTVEPVAARPG